MFEITYEYVMRLTINAGYESAKIEVEFNYKDCCNDEDKLHKLGSIAYEPKTCSQRTCFYDKYLPFSVWILKQVKPLTYLQDNVM